MKEKSDQRTCFIINAAAGKLKHKRRHSWLREEAKKRWAEFKVIEIGGDNPEDDWKTINPKDFDLIVSCGGDGTLHYLVNRLVTDDVSLGILPLGSGNDFSKALDLPDSITGCLDVLQSGKTKKVDALKCSGDSEKWCINTLGIGLDGLASVLTTTPKKYVGKLGYYIGACRSALKYSEHKIKLTVDGESDEKEFLMITACNGKREGGTFWVAPEAEVTDGKMNLFLLDKLSILKRLYYIPQFLTPNHPSLPAVETKTCRKIEVSSPVDLHVHADGEPIGETIRNFSVEVVPNAVKFVVP